MQRIAIIGGGAAGAAVVGEFLRGKGNGEELALTWLAGRQAPGRGVAYAARSNQHLLNVRAANMGLFADDVGAMLRFAQAHGLAAQATDFLPRAVFGDYVESTLARLISTHTAQCVVDLHAAEAVALHTRAGGGYHVRVENGVVLSVDAVVLAVGAPPPLPLPQTGVDALRSGRYLLDPWNLPPQAQAPQHVTVLGSGLTAADVILSVAGIWPDARITALSRHGRLPAAHRNEPGASHVHQADLIDALRTKADVRQWLRLIRATTSIDGLDWRSAIDGLRPVTVELWQSLDATQRRRFLRHVRWLWEQSRHRMPPQTANAIARLRDAGRLDLVAGRVLRIEGQSALTVTFRRRDDGTEHARAADLVIQATGFENATTHTSHPLLRLLFATGLARIDPHGLGVETTIDGRAVRADGSIASDLRVIGTLLRNALWECTALPEIRAMAAKLARELPADLRRMQARGDRPERIPDRDSRHIDMSIRQFGA